MQLAEDGCFIFTPVVYHTIVRSCPSDDSINIFSTNIFSVAKWLPGLLPLSSDCKSCSHECDKPKVKQNFSLFVSRGKNQDPESYSQKIK